MSTSLQGAVIAEAFRLIDANGGGGSVIVEDSSSSSSSSNGLLRGGGGGGGAASLEASVAQVQQLEQDKFALETKVYTLQLQAAASSSAASYGKGSFADDAALLAANAQNATLLESLQVQTTQY